VSKQLEKQFDEKVKGRAAELRAAAERVVSAERQMQQLQQAHNQLVQQRLHLEGRLVEAFDNYAEIAGHSHPLKAQFMPDTGQARTRPQDAGEGVPQATPPAASDPVPEKKPKKKG
jgi:hypothetical protein